MEVGRIYNKIDQWSDGRLFGILFAAFLVFYVCQIPSWTSNADVLAYACRASSDRPILTYSALDHRYRSLIGLEPLPNYHIAHTVLLWSVYHLVPGGWAQTLWPSGLVSAISGALAVGVTFLIWAWLGVRREVALITACVAGLIPSIWYHSLIGEVYALQLCLSLLFVYGFLRRKILASSAAFLAANLVTPLSGLAASFAFLKSRSWDTLGRMFLVGLFALIGYFGVFELIGSNIMKIFGPDTDVGGGRSLLWRGLKFGEIVILNLHILLPFVVWGFVIVWRERRDLFYGLLLGAAPQVLVAMYMGAFLTEGGAFLLLLFWVLSFPAGVALRRVPHKLYVMPVVFLAALVMTYGLWVIPSETDGRERYEIGRYLQSVTGDDMKIFGNWNAAVGVALGRFGWDFEALSSRYVQLDRVEEEKLLSTDQQSAIVVEFLRERLGLSSWYAKIGMTRTRESVADVVSSFHKSALTPIFDGEGLRVYRWERHPNGPRGEHR